MDRTVNFEGRLSKIDDILNKGCFDGTWDLVKPSYKYVSGNNFDSDGVIGEKVR